MGANTRIQARVFHQDTCVYAACQVPQLQKHTNHKMEFQEYYKVIPDKQ